MNRLTVSAFTGLARRGPSAALAVLIASTLAGLPTGAMAEPSPVKIGTPEPAKYRSRCPEDQQGMTGVCVLTSIKPAARGAFVVHNAFTGLFVDDIYPNSVRPLYPGKYMLYNTVNAGVEGYGVEFTVELGRVTNVTTATLQVISPWAVDMQTENDVVGHVPSGLQCQDMGFEMYPSGFWAFVPGTYILDAGGNFQINTPDCTRGEVPVTLTAGQTLKVKVKPGK